MVGALVLVAVAVIVVPPLLDGEGLESLPTAMPPPPPEIPAELPSGAEAARLRAQAEAGPGLPLRGDADGPQAWAVQVGSFSRRENAFALRERLRRQGFAAFVEPVIRGDGTRAWRVRVGPEPTRQEAEALKARLAEAVGGEPIVVAHEHGRGVGP